MTDSPDQGSRLLKNSVLTLINNLFSFLTTWIISIWVARSLGPDNYGIFSLVLWFSGTASWVVGLGFIHATTKFIAEFRGKGENQSIGPIILYILKIEIALTLFSTMILIFFRSEISRFFFTPHQSFFFFLAFLGLLPGTLTAVFSASIEGIQKFEYFLYSNLILTPLSFGAKIAALLMGTGIAGQLMVMLIISVINVVFYWIVLQREGAFRFPKGEKLTSLVKSRIMRYNNSVMAILVCDKVVWDKSETFFLGRLCTATQIGYYNLGFNIAQKFTSILPNTLWKVLFPAMSHYAGSGDRHKMERIFFLSTRYLAFFSFPVCIAGGLLAFPIIRFMYGTEFIGAQRTLQIIFLSSIFSNLAGPSASILYGYEKQAFIYKFGIVLAIINIGLDILLIKQYGAIGAAVCYSITTIIATLGGLIYTCRLMKLSYPFFSLFKIMFSTIIMGIVMQIILLKLPLIAGSITAILAGGIVYMVCSLVLGTFEKEDYLLVENVRKILPVRAQGVVDIWIRFMVQFKTPG